MIRKPSVLSPHRTSASLSDVSVVPSRSNSLRALERDGCPMYMSCLAEVAKRSGASSALPCASCCRFVPAKPKP